MTLTYISVVKLAAGRGSLEVSELHMPPTEPKRPRMLRQFRELVVLPTAVWQLVSLYLMVIDMSTVAQKMVNNEYRNGYKRKHMRTRMTNKEELVQLQKLQTQ